MGTISKQIADKIISGGYPQAGCVKIVTYNNQFDGALTYGAVQSGEDLLRYERSLACLNVKTIWQKETSKTVREPTTPVVSYNAAVGVASTALGWSAIKTEALFLQDPKLFKPANGDLPCLAATDLGQFILSNYSDRNNRDEY